VNCKPGDMAVVRGSCDEAEGMCVEVIRLMTVEEEDRACIASGRSPWWFCKAFSGAPAINGLTGDKQYGMPGQSWLFPDRQLRPIRPGDLEDETPTDIIRELTA
jgi:hypothetical protein